MMTQLQQLVITKAFTDAVVEGLSERKAGKDKEEKVEEPAAEEAAEAEAKEEPDQVYTIF